LETLALPLIAMISEAELAEVAALLAGSKEESPKSNEENTLGILISAEAFKAKFESLTPTAPSDPTAFTAA
jgi:hypothetical protein